MVQIPKTWNLNPSTNICPSCGNIHSIKIMIYKELMGEETFKTFNFRPNFCIKSHILAHNSQEGPCSHLTGLSVVSVGKGIRNRQGWPVVRITPCPHRLHSQTLWMGGILMGKWHLRETSAWQKLVPLCWFGQAGNFTVCKLQMGKCTQ